MDILKNNQTLIARKHFILRGVEHNNIEMTPEIENEIKEIDRQVSLDMSNYLKSCSEELVVNMNDEKLKAKTDGDMKRNVSSVIIRFLESNGFDNTDIKGIMRQGYKICRYR